MPSDQRFHPLTVIFALGGEIRNFLVPIIFATVTASSRGGDFRQWFLIFLVPGLFAAAGRYWFSTYRYDETELVVRTGIIFKNERHIPYARIQSVDAKQNVFHRAFGVVEVQVQTGTGGEAEATLSVLPLEALGEMRARVYVGKQAVTQEQAADPAASVDTSVSVAAAPVPVETILSLPVKEAALSGLLDNRGWVVIGAMSGLLYETGMFDRVEQLEALQDATWMMGVAFAAGLFVIAPVLSVVWAIIRLHGFTLTRRGHELLTEFGAFTKVTATIPLRRVQAVKVFRSPGHVLTGRASVRVETAGGGGTQRQQTAEREWIAPIIRQADLATFVGGLVPEVQLRDVDWQPADPRAANRRTRLAVYRALAIGALSAIWLEWHWVAAIVGGLSIWGAVSARQYVRNLGWARSDEAVYFRSGWLWKAITVVPLPKVQVVEFQESPFDRRWAMASVAVDTAGAGTHPIDVPYLPREVAAQLRATLASQAAATEYRW